MVKILSLSTFLELGVPCGFPFFFGIRTIFHKGLQLVLHIELGIALVFMEASYLLMCHGGIAYASVQAWQSMIYRVCICALLVVLGIAINAFNIPSMHDLKTCFLRYLNHISCKYKLDLGVRVIYELLERFHKWACLLDYFLVFP